MAMTIKPIQLMKVVLAVVAVVALWCGTGAVAAADDSDSAPSVVVENGTVHINSSWPSASVLINGWDVAAGMAESKRNLNSTQNDLQTLAAELRHEQALRQNATNTIHELMGELSVLRSQLNRTLAAQVQVLQNITRLQAAVTALQDSGAGGDSVLVMAYYRLRHAMSAAGASFTKFRVEVQPKQGDAFATSAHMAIENVRGSSNNFINAGGLCAWPLSSRAGDDLTFQGMSNNMLSTHSPTCCACVCE